MTECRVIQPHTSVTPSLLLQSFSDYELLNNHAVSLLPNALVYMRMRRISSLSRNIILYLPVCIQQQGRTTTCRLQSASPDVAQLLCGLGI
ncbi:unnamed protein product [Schistosoma margrebowiei]|uniref:Uncharacterized protein n=1 Tax=Schistosoma margrebowiei TaxID=48269 RepID=A0A183MLY4_9TREM|nr:unnamed protein product [Schistosoma margrebowiei]